MATQQTHSLARFMMAPSVILLFIWMIVPLAFTLWFSFLQYNPLNPMRDSNLVRVLARQSTTQIDLVDLATVTRGADAVRARLAELSGKGIGGTIIDATGNATVLAQLLPIAAMRGRVVILGNTGFPSAQHLTDDVITRALHIVGAHDVLSMLDRFQVTDVGPSEALNQWLGAMLRLFRPQILELLRLRDQNVMAWRRRKRTHVLDDPALEITSHLDVSLDVQVAFLDRMRSERAARLASRRVPVLPALSEGWGEGQTD